MYRSNKVIVFNKYYRRCCKSKMIFYDEDCNYKYRFKVIKYCKKDKITYKVYVTVISKESNKKYRFKFKF